MATLVSHINDLAIAIRTKFNTMNDKFSADTITVTLDGGGLLIKTGARLDVPVPFPCVLKSWTLLADQIGFLTVDIWKSDYASFPPTVASSIMSTAKPLLSSAIKSTGVIPSGPLSLCAAGDILRFNVDAISLIQRATLTLYVKRV